MNSKLSENFFIILVFSITTFVICSAIIFFAEKPSNTRNWTRDQMILPSARIEGDIVTFYNVRNFKYKSTTDYSPAYYDMTLDLQRLQTVDFILEPFSEFRGAAHSFLSFGFSDGEYLSISPEIRKEKGEEFSALKGIFNQYELMYVLADERDVVKLRTNFRKDDVYIYPIKTSPEKMRALLISMLKKTNQLQWEPEFYNTLTNNCSLAIADHVNAITPKKVPWSYKMIMPGYADELAFDLDLINTELPIEEARKKYCVSEKAIKYGDETHFSQKIRELE